VRYLGAYSSKARAYRNKRSLTLQSVSDSANSPTQADPELSPKRRAALRKNWAQLIKRVYLVDPLKCDCVETYRVIAFITDHKVITKILEHLK
jgi:hypothetical protein